MNSFLVRRFACCRPRSRGVAHLVLPRRIALSNAPGRTPSQSVKCPGLTSPDQQLRACVLSVGTHPNPPFNESRVEIRNMKGTVLATEDFKSADGEHGCNVQKMGVVAQLTVLRFQHRKFGWTLTVALADVLLRSQTECLQRSGRLHRASHQAKLQIECPRLDPSPSAGHCRGS
jgi:hypothetical protein